MMSLIAFISFYSTDIHTNVHIFTRIYIILKLGIILIDSFAIIDKCFLLTRLLQAGKAIKWPLGIFQYI